MNIRDLADHESPANGLIKGPSSPDDLANCHAEGRGFESHQPLFANPLHVGGSGSARVAEIKWNHRRIAPPFWALVPEMAQMRGD
jgi:hypothetical protein